MDRVEDVGVVATLTMSEVLISRPPLDHTAVGRGLPTILEAEITMVSPARTDTPSFMSGSIVMLGGSVGNGKHQKCVYGVLVIKIGL